MRINGKMAFNGSKRRELVCQHAARRASRAGLGHVEYLIVVAIISGLVLAGAAGVGKTVWSRAQEANSALAPDYRPMASARTSGESPHALTSPAPAAKAELSEQSPAVGIWLLVLGCLCGVAYALGERSRRRRDRRAEADSHNVSESQIRETENKLFAKRQDLLRMLHSNVQLLATNGITVRHLMTANPVTASPEAAVKKIMPLMKDNRVHHVLVCDAARRLLGVISDRDLRGRSGRLASQIMTPLPHVVSPNTPLATAVSQLVGRQISCLPVVEDGRLCGVLTTTDLVLVAHAFLQLWLRLRQDPRPEDSALSPATAAIE